MATDWGSLLVSSLPSLISAGGGLYDYFQQKGISKDLQQQATSGAVDPFGQGNRAMYQQKLANLYQDPTSIQNTPGYQFALQQGTKGVNREAAKMGKYISPNRLYDLAEFQQGLASTTYNTEADRLMKLSGAQFGPDAGAYTDMYQSGAAAKDQATGSLTGGLMDLLKSPLGEMGTDYAKSKLNEWLTPSGDAGVDSGYGDSPGPLRNPNEGGSGSAAAPDLTGADAQWGVNQQKNMFGPGGTVPGGDFDALNTGGGDAGIDSLYGDMPGPITGGGASNLITGAPGQGSLDILKGQYQGAKEMFGQGTKLSSAGGALGGMLGGYLGSKLDTRTPIGGLLGSVGGTFGGATLASLGGGTALGSIGGGVGGAAATGALGAGMAAAGPAAIAAVALMVAQGVAGTVQSRKRKNKERDKYRATAGEILSGPSIDDPTGLGLGQGTMYNKGGYEFFLPGKNYESLNAKNKSGEYLSQWGLESLQGNFGWYNDQNTGWTAGSFGNGATDFSLGSWRPVDYQGLQDKFAGTQQQRGANLTEQRANNDWNYSTTGVDDTGIQYQRGYDGSKERLSGSVETLAVPGLGNPNASGGGWDYTAGGRKRSYSGSKERLSGSVEYLNQDGSWGNSDPFAPPQREDP